MRMHHRRWAGAAAALAVTGLMLTGCSAAGTDESTNAANNAVTNADSANFAVAALSKTQEEGSARVTGSMEIEVAGEQVSTTIEGVQSFSPDAADLTMRTDILGQGAELRTILIDDVAYLKVDILGDSWFKADASDFGSGSADPAATLDALKEIANVQQTGTGSEDGVAVTYYEGELDINQALSSAGLDDEESAQLEKFLGQTDAASVPFKFAVDDQGRVVKAEMNWDFSSEDGQALKLTSIVRYTDFGVDTDIQAPPADQVQDLESLGLGNLKPQE